MKPLNIRFILIMVLYGGIVLLTYRDEVLGVALAPLAEATAIVTSTVLRWCAIPVIRDGAILTHSSGFSYEVAYICTGFLPSVTFIVCVFASLGTLPNKIIGVLCGVPILLLINYIRLINLFYIGVFYPASFDFAHEVVWEALQAMAFITIWVSWMYWANRHKTFFWKQARRTLIRL